MEVNQFMSCVTCMISVYVEHYFMGPSLLYIVPCKASSHSAYCCYQFICSLLDLSFLCKIVVIFNCFQHGVHLGLTGPRWPHVGSTNLAIWLNHSTIHPMKYANSFIMLFVMAILSVPLDSRGRVSITCAISLQRNTMKYNYIFIWTQCIKKSLIAQFSKLLIFSIYLYKI